MKELVLTTSYFCSVLRLLQGQQSLLPSRHRYHFSSPGQMLECTPHALRSKSK